MEVRDIVNKFGIIGVISSYQSNFNKTGKISNLGIKDLEKALQIVGLDESYINKDINELTISELFKIELMTKLENDLIIVGDLSNILNYKDEEYIKKLLLKLNRDYGKKIVVIDNDVSIFFNLTKNIFVIKDNEIIYSTNDYYDDDLYKYTNMPKIIDFIKYINKDMKVLNENIEIYELIKDIYRSVR